VIKKMAKQQSAQNAKEELEQLLLQMSEDEHKALTDLIDVIPMKSKAFNKLVQALPAKTRTTYEVHIKQLTKLNAILELNNGKTSTIDNSNGKAAIKDEEEEEEEDKEKLKSMYLPFCIDGKVCFEAVNFAGVDTWLYFHDTEFKVTSEIVTTTHEIYPLQHTKTQFVLKPEQLKYPVPTTAELYQDLHDLVSDFYQHPDDRIAKFLALYLLSSYVITKAPGTIFVWLVGAKRAGKTTLQIIAEATGYRAFAGVDASEAAIFRTLGSNVEYGPLIMLREFEKASEEMRILAREGDIPGATVPRADKEGERFVVNHYRLYGTRIVASNSLHGNEADMDRYIVIKCVKAKPKHERAQLYTDPIMIDWLSTLRSRLLRWKVANYAKIRFPLVDPQNQLEGRDWEHFAAVLSLAAEIDKNLEQDVRGYINEYIKDKDEESAGTATSLLRDAVLTLIKSGEYNYGDGYRIPAYAVWDQIIANTDPVILDDGSASTTKRLLPDGTILSIHKTGKILREHLGAKVPSPWKDQAGKSIKGYIWSKNAIDAWLSVTSTDSTNSTVLGEKDGEKSPQNEPLFAKRSPNQGDFSDGSQLKTVETVEDKNGSNITSDTDKASAITKIECPFCKQKFDTPKEVLSHSLNVHPRRPVVAELAKRGYSVD
jgi:hypothetical protein